jgi:hypothetical protein
MGMNLAPQMVCKGGHNQKIHCTILGRLARR